VNTSHTNMRSYLTTANLSGLQHEEALALSEDPYYQPQPWDWAYENGRRPVWTDPDEPENTEKGVKSRNKPTRSKMKIL